MNTTTTKGTSTTCTPATTKGPNKVLSLFNLCRNVIVTNLERYPPEAFTICDDETWINIVQLRHRKTTPKEGSGGLDGTGRMVPAVSEKFLEAVEEYNTHLTDIPATDELLWKDLVEYRFRRNGLTRPTALLYPYPILIERIQSTVNSIINSNNKNPSDNSDNQLTDPDSIKVAVKELSNIPMSVSLLKETGVGKTLKKFLKSSPDSNIFDTETLQTLQTILSSWMELAANSGVEMKGVAACKKAAASEDDVRKKEQEEDLELVESCSNWRQLFATLKNREEERRNSQGRRMREIRQNLAATRPKLVKVRPSVSRPIKPMDNSFGYHQPSSSSGNGSSKLIQIRKETMAQAARQTVATQPPKASFSNAVAFASCSIKGKRSKPSTTVELAGNKRMKVPDQVVRGAGPRQMASKWKVCKK